MGTLRFISDLDDIDFPSGLIDIEIKKENISYSEQYDFPSNEFEIEDSKPCIADLDEKLIKSNPETKKKVRVKKEGSKEVVIRKKKWKCDFLLFGG